MKRNCPQKHFGMGYGKMHGFHTIFLEQLRFAFRGSQWTIWHQWIIVLGVQGNLNWMPGYDVCSKVKGLNIGMSLNLHPFIFLFYLFISIITYEGWSKSSDVYLAALSRDIFERHTMHHSKELAFIFIMMLVFSRCTVSFNTVITAHSIWPTPASNTTCIIQTWIYYSNIRGQFHQ